MSIVQLVNLFATAVGLDYKTLAANLQTAIDNTGDLSLLTSADKSSVVNALNSIKSEIDAIPGTDYAQIQTMIDSGLAGLVNGAPDALNTLNEIALALSEDQAALDGILQSLAKRVRVDAPQAFTEVEKAQGRENVGAASAEEVGDVPSADFVATYNASKTA